MTVWQTNRSLMDRPGLIKFIHKSFFIVLIFFLPSLLLGQTRAGTELSSLVIARVKYKGGGDWYNDPSAIPNLGEFIVMNTGVDISNEEARVSLTEETLFSYPILFMTGHGRIVLIQEELKRLRTYLLKGGFLYADDDYGMDFYFRSVMRKVFPDRTFKELPFSHEIYRCFYKFENGLPKIHEHDNKPPQGFGIFDDYERLMVFYTYETNISDGWADPKVHKDPPEKREAALKMGTNIIIYALLH